MKYIIIDIGSHKCEELNVLLNFNFEKIKFYLKWWLDYLFYLSKKFFFISKNDYVIYGYKFSPLSVNISDHVNILVNLLKKIPKKKLEIVSFEPNYFICLDYIKKISTKFNITYYPLLIEKDKKNKTLILRDYYIFPNSLSNAIFKKNKTFLIKKKIPSLDIDFFLKNLASFKNIKNYKLLLRINCEGSEYNIIKRFIANNVKFKNILGSINDIKKIHGDKMLNEIENLLKKKKINYFYFKGSDPSTWNDARAVLLSFLK
jgi:hypothetical protein